MKSLTLILLLLSTLSLHALDQVKLPNNTRYSKDLIAYLKESDTPMTTGEQFTTIENSEATITHLIHYYDYLQEKLHLIAMNIANANSTRTETGKPYQRQYLVFLDNGNWEVRTDETPGPLAYDPNHPHANDEGYVPFPNVIVEREQVEITGIARELELVQKILEKFDPEIVF